MSHKKFGPDRFSRFDVYWIQTNRQTDRQTNRQAKFIYRCVVFLGSPFIPTEIILKRGYPLKKLNTCCKL